MDLLSFIAALLTIFESGNRWVIKPLREKLMARLKASESEEIMMQNIHPTLANFLSTSMPHLAEIPRLREEVGNITAILGMAVEQARFIKSDRVEIPSSDWCARFCDCASEVSEEEVRRAWAKLLTAQITSDAKFSKRTLDVLHNMSKEEARTLTEVAPYIIADFVPEIAYQFIDQGLIIGLIDCGVFNPVSIDCSLPITPDAPTIEMRGALLRLTANELPTEITFTATHALTVAGRELRRLVEAQTSATFAQAVSSHIESAYTNVKVDIISE